ncbi:hypothetical protein [Pseudomonas sp. CYM-20-01]|jgi:hypothetical protein|uniref:hypothetical protein n=1 Tax=Pseudomonas sp. CYM-20-01 TaxID=2870750 RepID=UPI0020BDA6C0|nr:hypothetical protein [Pseudomonas sp. CYM-20-01]
MERALSARAGSTKKRPSRHDHTTHSLKKLKKILLSSRKTSTDMLDGPCARSSGATGDHRFNGPRIRVDQLQRITRLKMQFSDMHTQMNTLSWNRTLTADDNTKTAAPIKTSQNAAIQSSRQIEKEQAMQRSPYSAMSSQTRSSCQDEAQYYRLNSFEGYPDSVLYQVVPAGRNFFHVREVLSGRIKGFRSDHVKACELARKLEAMLHAPHGAIVSSAR